MKPAFAEVFAGGGGLSRGLELAGWECKWHAEIEEQAASVLTTRWPKTPLVGDVCQLDGRELVRLYGRILMLSGGSPCQGLSGAGLRQGLADSRSILFFQQMRLWDETGADLCLWENVDNARHSNDGKDFAEVLRAFVGAPVPLPSTGWRSAGVAAGPSGVAAWRVLDSQFLGVPQRRSRVFVLGTRAGIVDPAEVLSLGEGLRRHSPASRRTRQGVPRSSTASAREPSGIGDELGGFGLLERDGVADPITASEGDTYTHEGENNFRLHNVTLENAEAIAFNTKQDGHDASAGVAPTLLAMPHDESHANGGGQLGGVAFDHYNQRDTGGVSHTLRTAQGGETTPVVVAFDLAQITHPDNGSSVRPGDPSPTLNKSGAVHVMAVDGEGNATGEVSGALDTHHSSHNRGAILELEAFNEVGQEKWQGERIAGTVTDHEAKEPHTLIAGTLQANGGGVERPAGQRNELDFVIVQDVASPITTRSGSAPDRGDGLDNVIVDDSEAEQTDAFAFTKSHYTRGRPGEPSPIVPTLAADTGQGDNEPLVFEVAGSRHAGGFQSAQSAAAGHLQPTLGVPRRLMPIECERLMGWPDDWTLVPDPKKKGRKMLSDSARYRICGNGVTAVHAQWLGWRLLEELRR